MKEYPSDIQPSDDAISVAACVVISAMIAIAWLLLGLGINGNHPNSEPIIYWFQVNPWLRMRFILEWIEIILVLPATLFFLACWVCRKVDGKEG